jgi:hypothetical protein
MSKKLGVGLKRYRRFVFRCVWCRGFGYAITSTVSAVLRVADVFVTDRIASCAARDNAICSGSGGALLMVV